MTNSTLISIAAVVALAVTLLPINGWQLFQQRSLGWLLSLVRALAVALGGLFCFAPHYAPEALAAALGHPMSHEWLLAAAAVSFGLLPVTAVLGFAVRQYRTEQSVHGLRQSLQQSATALDELLEQGRAPGAVVTPERRDEIRTALADFRGRPETAKKEKPRTIRTTLRQLIRSGRSAATS